ncbi:MAG TPA: M2 family metallopeptidase [Bryobacteraceae bacterium]|nr:M2 family metallopeptidase [Bryobacteraceae bacterium]
MRRLAAVFCLGSGFCLAATNSKPPTLAEARAFMERAQAKLLELSTEDQRADWVKSTYITTDTETLSARADEEVIKVTMQLAKESTRFKNLKMPADLARQFELLRLSLPLAAPSDPKEARELTEIASKMEGMYGSGKYCPEAGHCMDLDQLSDILRTSTDPKQLLDAWRGWRTISVPMRPLYERYVVLANKGARELGFADMGAMWRSKYDMSPDAFITETDRLWDQVKPLYLALHAYVRWKLREKYGDVVPAQGPIPADLLGNMWAQEWENIYPLVAPKDTDPGYDLTAILKAKNTQPLDMVRYGEHFFTSLGFAPLPKTFWERSLFVKPRDRDVVCHASAWDIDSVDDLRLKMCIEINSEDFSTVHHELGHNFYQRAYDTQPFFFRDGANEGFHEAIGDTIALSVTPQYLHKIGLLENVPDSSKDIGLLLYKALEKVAFLPFGLMIDKWRWEVLSGQVPPDKYNESWWKLRLQYQGIEPPGPRSEADFDPGAKYHVPANYSYTRYFLADILQFQFHRALAKAAGCTAPLNRCSIYDSKAAGEKLNAMLEMGASKPWPEALEVLTGQKQMDATAILDYFAPLKKWLDEQNRGKPVGWQIASRYTQ